MKLEEMRYFVEIVKSGSINQASKILYVAQPALSRTIASLERELGFPLLERSKHGVVPTTEGRTVYDDCLKILSLYSNCERHWETLAYHKQENAEPVTIQIVALPMICNNTMNQVMVEMAKNYPRIRLKLFERQLPTVLETAISEPHSIAISHYNKATKPIVYTYAKKHNMQVLPLFDDEYRLFASKDNPIVGHILNKETLAEHTLIDYAQQEEERQQVSFKEAGISSITALFKNVIYLSNRYDMEELAASSPLLTLSAFRMTQENPNRKNHRLVPLTIQDFHVPMTYYILYKQNPTLEEKITVNVLQDFYMDLARLPLT